MFLIFYFHEIGKNMFNILFDYSGQPFFKVSTILNNFIGIGLGYIIL